MTECYCVKIEDSAVVQVIVCSSATWASQNLGGVWVSAGDVLVGVGWTYSVNDGLRPPQPYPSWQWIGNQWAAPTPMPEEGEWWWDEEVLQWQAAQQP